MATLKIFDMMIQFDIYSKEHVKIIETRPREIGFVLWGHCQNLLDDPRNFAALFNCTPVDRASISMMAPTLSYSF